MNSFYFPAIDQLSRISLYKGLNMMTSIYLSQYVELNPYNPSKYDLLAAVYEAKGCYSEAI
jgi:DNA-binding SARP family transcriptional activator